MKEQIFQRLINLGFELITKLIHNFQFNGSRRARKKLLKQQENLLEQDASSIKPDTVVWSAIPISPKDLPPTPAVIQAAQSYPKKYCWCLDAGHGALQPGKRSLKWVDENGQEQQFFEYEFNRDIVKRIAKGLDELNIDYFIVMPKVNVGAALKERCDRANLHETYLKKIFVSIHANALGKGEWVEKREGRDVWGAETWFHQSSVVGKYLASIFQNNLVEKTGFRNRGIKNKTGQQFFVLQHTNMASVLIECGFFSHPVQVKDLQDPEMRQRIAEAIINSISTNEMNGIPGY